VILVDTSVWVDHLRRGNRQLERHLEEGEVACHPFIIGELVCGNLKRRSEVLSLLKAMPAPLLARHEEVMDLVGRHRLQGRGLGWVDAHLLASAALSNCSIWTKDRSLQVAAEKLGLSI
jgi:predicted nucleic acid-binding protein